MWKVEAKKVMWLEFDHSYLVAEMDLEPVLVWWSILSVPLTKSLTFYNRVFLLYGDKDSVLFKLLEDFSKSSTWRDSKFALSELEKSSDIALEMQGHIPRLTIAHFKMPAWGTPGWKKNEFLICHIAKYNAYVSQHLMDGKSLSSVSATYENCMSFP